MIATALPVETARDSRERRYEKTTPPDSNFAARLELIKTARNALLEAAQPLLRALAEMPQQLMVNAIEPLRVLLEQEVRTFKKLCEQANIRRDHALGASYCLCTALDEAAMQTRWAKESSEKLGKWITDGLAVTFHEDRQGGDKIYFLIGRLMTEPQEHIDLLEVIYRVLSLGFEGRYRVAADGRRQHDAVRQRLYTEITAQRGSAPSKLSTHCEADTRHRMRPVYEFPVWITAVVLSLLLLGFFSYTKYTLLVRTAALQKSIIEIGEMMPPPPSPSLNLRALLKEEIAAGKVSVEQDAHNSTVTLHGDEAFIAGKADVNKTMRPLIEKIAAQIVKVPGRVTVTGYTDNQPIHSRVFASNQALSEERATQMMQLLQADGVPANRPRSHRPWRYTAGCRQCHLSRTCAEPSCCDHRRGVTV